MDKNKKKETFLAYCKEIKALGYKVLISDDEYFNYGYIVNSENKIGYFQLGTYGYGIQFSTMHKPTRDIGTGFGLDADGDYKTEMTRQVVDRCFEFAPSWAKGGDVAQVKKWDADEFLKQAWNKDRLIEL